MAITVPFQHREQQTAWKNGLPANDRQVTPRTRASLYRGFVRDRSGPIRLEGAEWLVGRVECRADRGSGRIAAAVGQDGPRVI